MVEKKDTKKKAPAGKPAKPPAAKKTAAPLLRRRKAAPAEREDAVPAATPRPEPARSGPPPMGLHELAPARGATRSRKRVGRGPGSGHGKTAGRGNKGQKSRSGYRHQRGFEGGQMPLHRRIPKRGFVSTTRNDTAEVRLSDLAKLPVADIDFLALKAAGVVPTLAKAAKVIKSGALTKAVKLTGIAVTKGAKAAIEAAGGSVA